MEDQTLLLEDHPLQKADGQRGVHMVRMIALTAILAVAGVCFATTQETTLRSLKPSQTIEMVSPVFSIKVDAKLLHEGLEIYKQIKNDMDKFFHLDEFARQMEGLEKQMVKLHDYLKPEERKAYKKVAKARFSSLKAVTQAKLVTETIHSQAVLLQLILEQEGQENEKVRSACAVFIKESKVTANNVNTAMRGLHVAVHDVLNAEESLDTLMAAMDRFMQEVKSREATNKAQARSTCAKNGLWGLLAGPIGLVIGEAIASHSCETNWIPKLSHEFNARKAEITAYKNDFAARKQVLAGLHVDLGKRIQKLVHVEGQYKTVRTAAEAVVEGVHMIFQPLLQSVKTLVRMTA